MGKGKLKIHQEKDLLKFDLKNKDNTRCSATVNKNTGELDLDGDEGCQKVLLEQIKKRTE